MLQQIPITNFSIICKDYLVSLLFLGMEYLVRRRQAGCIFAIDEEFEVTGRKMIQLKI